MARPKLACPASAFTHPVLSLNPLDVECQLTGNVRPAGGSICCTAIGSGSYLTCPVWRLWRDMQRMGKEREVLQIRTPKPHDLGLERAA